MKPTPLLTGWTCRHLGDTAPGKAVTLPHDAMLAEPRTAISAGGTNTGWYEGYDYEYQRTLTVPENELADTHILEFEGVYHNAEVWLNGQKAAFRPYGYTNFYVDCAPYLHAGENELRVIARNADQPNSRWYSGAGIYRPVQLWKARGAHITLNGVKIRTLSLQPAIVEVRVKTTAPGTVRLTVDDLPAMQQESDGEAVFTLTLDNARLWTPETPNLYTCRVSFADDEVTETFGVRKVEWGTDGFLLNGKRYIIQGACIHHDNGLLGAVCDPDAVARKVRLLKENGYNAIRSAHNPCSKALLTECDRQGMLVMDEYIDHWYIHKTEHDYVDYFNDWWRQDLTDMVEKPSLTEVLSNYSILGRVVLPPEIFSILEQTPPGAGGEIQLTDAMKVLAKTRGMMGVEYTGTRYDMGNKFGILQAIVEVALQHPQVKDQFREYLKSIAATL